MKDDTKKYRIGIDVGGTFTDLIVFDAESSTTRTVKTLSTKSPAEGILTALEKAEVDFSEIETLVFGSTLAINALIQKRYAQVGTITNKGFKDTLELRRIWRRHLFGSFWDRPEGMVQRRFRSEISSRVNVSGQVVEDVNAEEVVATVQDLVDRGVESLAISLLHAHVNPVHELEVKNIIKQNFPEISVSISSEESPEVGEYERLSTTVVSAALKPLIHAELNKLVSTLKSRGMSGSIHVMKSNGGVMSIDSAVRKPHELVQSGPSGGVSAARRWGAELSAPNVVTLDIGGTTADASLIQNGKPIVSRQMELDWDIPVRVTLVDIKSVGAGGGSIAWVDQAGLPRLGPDSAGSDPGPAAFDQGGTRPTVTDAALLAGWLNADNFAGGEITMNLENSISAIKKEGLEAALKAKTVSEAAAGILAMATNSIAEQVRALIVKHGQDPRDYTLLVYGGAGGLFGADVAEALGMERVILPPNSSVLSAWGGLLADEEHDYARNVLSKVEELDYDRLRKYATEMLDQAQLDFAPGGQQNDFYLDLRYEGQTHVLTIPVPDPSNKESVLQAAHNFELQHLERYGHDRPEDSVEVFALRLHSHKRLVSDDSELVVVNENQAKSSELEEPREVARYATPIQKWNVYDRSALRVASEVTAPAIIEDNNSTFLVSSEWKIKVGAYGEIELLKEEQ